MDGKTLERMRVEFSEVHARRVKLVQFLNDYLYDCIFCFEKISPEIHEDFETLCEQCKAMQEYEITLAKRILKATN